MKACSSSRTQVAGFNQVFRSIISESVVGSVAAPEYETAGFLAEYKLGTGTYAGVQATLLKSEVTAEIGTFDAFTEGGSSTADRRLFDAAAPRLRRAEPRALTATSSSATSGPSARAIS